IRAPARLAQEKCDSSLTDTHDGREREISYHAAHTAGSVTISESAKPMASIAVQSSLQLYLRQINESPLLTADEEKQLARRIIHHQDMMARERMVRSNLRLVVNIAKHYINRGLWLPHLIEEGNIGVLKAATGL